MTSMGTPNRRGRSPAAARRAESRPSAATVRSASTRTGPSGPSAVRPRTASPSRISPVASVRRSSRKFGWRPPCSARKVRKSHCGARTRKSSGGGSLPKSIGCSRVPSTTASSVRMLVCGRPRNASRSPSSPSTPTVDGWMVSPRKSRKKSACFSSTTTSSPARARISPSIIPAGPPPEMAQDACSDSITTQRSLPP